RDLIHDNGFVSIDASATVEPFPTVSPSPASRWRKARAGREAGHDDETGPDTRAGDGIELPTHVFRMSLSVLHAFNRSPSAFAPNRPRFFAVTSALKNQAGGCAMGE